MLRAVTMAEPTELVLAERERFKRECAFVKKRIHTVRRGDRLPSHEPPAARCTVGCRIPHLPPVGRYSILVWLLRVVADPSHNAAATVVRSERPLPYSRPRAVLRRQVREEILKMLEHKNGKVFLKKEAKRQKELRKVRLPGCTTIHGLGGRPRKGQAGNAGMMQPSRQWCTDGVSRSLPAAAHRMQNGHDAAAEAS